MKTLPVYSLAIPPQPRLDYIHDLSTKLFGIEDYSLHETNGRNLLRSTTHLIDIDNENGAIWAADRSQLWNPKVKPRLPDKQKAREIADEFLRKNDLLPKVERDRFVVEQQDAAASYLSTLDIKTGERENRQLDYRVSYGVRIIVEDPETRSILQVPVISGGGKFGVTIGDADRVIAYNSAWRPLDTEENHAAYIPREIADRRFKKIMANLKIESFDADLVYSYMQSLNKQQYLYPAWAYRAMGNINGHKFPLRIITIPATEFGPKPQLSERQLKRSKREIPRSWETTTKRRGLRAINPFEAGTSWIGSIGGLSGSKKNAQGFVDGLQDAGWKINFNWGNCNAWETDWHENDDDYVDAADFVFYTGHAGLDGWQLVNPSNCASDYLSSSEVGAGPETPGDIWGRQDLEWIIIAACGPLEDDILSPDGGDVLARWDGAFDGLHLLMGYGAVTFDNEKEGRRVIKYAREGQSLIEAWFRAAQEIQPSTNGWGNPYGPIIYVGAMWASKSGLPSPANDHLWGYGSVAPDPTSPDMFSCMWVPC